MSDASNEIVAQAEKPRSFPLGQALAVLGILSIFAVLVLLMYSINSAYAPKPIVEGLSPLQKLEGVQADAKNRLESVNELDKLRTGKPGSLQIPVALAIEKFIAEGGELPKDRPKPPGALVVTPTKKTMEPRPDKPIVK